MGALISSSDLMHNTKTARFGAPFFFANFFPKVPCPYLIFKFPPSHYIAFRLIAKPDQFHYNEIYVAFELLMSRRRKAFWQVVFFLRLIFGLTTIFPSRVEGRAHYESDGDAPLFFILYLLRAALRFVPLLYADPGACRAAAKPALYSSAAEYAFLRAQQHRRRVL